MTGLRAAVAARDGYVSGRMAEASGRRGGSAAGEKTLPPPPWGSVNIFLAPGSALSGGIGGG